MINPFEKGKISFSKWMKRIKKERALVNLLAICLVLLLLCIALAGYHVQRIFKAFEQNSYDFIINRSELTSKYFSEDFERKGAFVSAEALVLAQNEAIDKESICTCLKVLEETGEFSYARYVSNRGIVYLNSTMMNAYSDAIDMAKNVTIYKNFAPERSSDEMSFASPVLKNGVFQGYMIGVTNAGKMFEGRSSRSSTMVAERYLTDAQGNIVAYIKNDTIYDGSGKNIFDILTRDCIDDYAAQEVRDEVLNEVSSEAIVNRSISVNGRTGYALYKQLVGGDGWNLFYIVYTDEVRKTIQPVLVEAFISMV